jgi:hypothetical protein
MKQPNANRFGTGSLVAAFFAGAFFSQALDSDQSSVPSQASSARTIDTLQIETFAALPKPSPAFDPELKSEVAEAYQPQPIYEESSEPDNNVFYRNCSAARAAGAAPVYAGEPGYASHLDRDGDGVGCE